MRLGNLLLLEAPFGVPYSPAAFRDTFAHVAAEDALGSDRGSRLCAAGGLFVDVRPRGDGKAGASVDVWGFRPDKPGADFYGRWGNLALHGPGDVERALERVEAVIRDEGGAG